MIYEYPKFKIPSSVTAGLYYVLAYVDFTKKISESNENNNFKASVSKVNINDKTAPKVSSTVPINNMMGYNRTSSILIKFTENITTSTYYNSIKIKNLTTNKDVELTKAISGNTLALKTSTRTANTWYQVTIPLAAVRDLAGNNLTTTYSFKFKTGA
jgi:hypothetical protein